MRIVLAFLLFSFVFTQPLSAGRLDEVDTFVRTKVNKILTLIRNKKLSPKARNKKLIKAIRPVIDFKIVAKLSLGSKNKKKFTKKQYKKFRKLFIARLEDSFIEKLDLYTDEKIEFQKPVEVDKKRVKMMIHLISSDDVIELLLKLYKNKRGKWKAYDLELLGVSIVQTYRTQFENALKGQTAESLLKKMSKQGSFKIPEGEKKKEEKKKK